jgi:hypothetical protein
MSVTFRKPNNNQLPSIAKYKVKILRRVSNPHKVCAPAQSRNHTLATQISHSKSCYLPQFNCESKFDQYKENDSLQLYFRKIKEVQIAHKRLLYKVKELSKKNRSKSFNQPNNYDPFQEMGLLGNTDIIESPSILKTKITLPSKTRNGKALEKFYNKEIKKAFTKQFLNIYNCHRKLVL